MNKYSLLPGGNRGDAFYRNPVMRMESADPAIRRNGEDFYMCYSCYSNKRSLAIWHSRNLVDWEFFTWVLNNQDHKGATAPDIEFFGGRVFVYYQVGQTLWAAWADQVEGPWSDPVDLGIAGIDAAHVVDREGKRWLHYNAGRMIRLSHDGLSTVGKSRKVFEPWPVPDTYVIEGICQEAPNLIFKDDWYYLVVAQGGTSGPPTAHMCAMARSKDPWGPWEYSPYNPVIRTRFREEPFWQMGHGTLVDTPSGDWYMMFHAYNKDYYTLGRHIMLLPVEWDKQGWCRVKDGVASDSPIPLPGGDVVAHGWDLGTDFSNDELIPALEWDLSVPEGSYIPCDGRLVMTPFADSVEDTRPLSFLPSHRSYEVETCVSVEAVQAAGMRAGLCLGYGRGDKGLFKQASIEFDGNRVFIGGHDHISASVNAASVRLKIVNDRHSVQFYYAPVAAGEDLDRQVGPEGWKKLPWGYDTSGWHHNSFGGFNLLKPGLYCIGSEKAYAEYYYYRGIEE